MIVHDFSDAASSIWYAEGCSNLKLLEYFDEGPHKEIDLVYAAHTLVGAIPEAYKYRD